jgi:tRNA U34 5-carboxymethylaminomethyl modifying GTPase MnmE/TrmE
MAVSEAEAALIAARQSLAAAHDEQVVLVDLYRASNALALLTGAITRDDVFMEIFTKFCIGK